MPATYAPNLALLYAKKVVRGMPLDDAQVQYRVMDDAQKTIWNAAPWRWTTENLVPITLVADQSDYTIAPTGTPVRIARAYRTNGQTTTWFWPSGQGPATANLSAPPMDISIVDATTVRLWPPPGAMKETWKMVIALKLESPSITSANAGTGGALIMDDEYYPVYTQWVLYHAMVWAYDSRAGGAQVDPQTGRIQYSGQLGVASAYLEEMRRRENIWAEMDYRPDNRADKR